MVSLVLGASVVCAAAVAAAVRSSALVRGARSLPLAAAFAANAGWVFILSLYLVHPLSSGRARVLLAVLPLSVWPWLMVALAADQTKPTTRRQRWALPILAAAICGIAAAAIWGYGIDWVTGIGEQPAVVVSPVGWRAMAASATLGLLASVLLLAQLRHAMADAPAQFAGALGGAAAPTWICLEILLHGYLTVDYLQAAAVLGTAAAAVFVFGVWRERPPQGLPVLSRRLVYGAAIASLVIVYVAAAGALLSWTAQLGERLIPVLLPGTAFLAAVGLLATAGSRRLRYRVWTGLGRHLFGGKHDYGEVWIGLTDIVSKARSRLDLVRGAVSFCRNTLGVGEASVWLADGSMLRRADLAGSNGAVREVPYPGDSEAALATATGSAFACALRAGERLLGVLAVGSAGRGAPLDDEDREVARHVAAQIGSALELQRLGEEIADSREVASFHRVSTFVVHDLKNLVAQQSFVLENARRFAENPAFVRDALEAFADSTDRMRSLIGRLRSRHEVERGNGSACDLAEVVRELTAFPRLSLPTRASLDVVAPQTPGSCPVPLDRGAAVQVLNNLLGNAIESLPDGQGKVTVAITREAKTCRLDVSDNGHGISPEFIHDHLFRPFRTTKEDGIGIGLYQCKATVEAAGGTIAIRSDLKVGTTVSVTLPALADGVPAPHEGRS